MAPPTTKPRLVKDGAEGKTTAAEMRRRWVDYFLNPDATENVKIQNRCLKRGKVEDTDAEDYGLGAQRQCFNVGGKPLKPKLNEELHRTEKVGSGFEVQYNVVAEKKTTKSKFDIVVTFTEVEGGCQVTYAFLMGGCMGRVAKRAIQKGPMGPKGFFTHCQNNFCDALEKHMTGTPMATPNYDELAKEEELAKAETLLESPKVPEAKPVAEPELDLPGAVAVDAN